jgi:hypothetical protein
MLPLYDCTVNINSVWALVETLGEILISTAIHQRLLLDQNHDYYKCHAVWKKEWEEFAKKEQEWKRNC